MRWIAALLLLLGVAPASAETISIPRQFGIAFIPTLMMEDGHIIEKHAAALGVPDLQVNWVVLNGAAPVNDALLSGAIAFGIGAPPALILLWDRTRTQSNQVRGLGAVAMMPTTLNTRNPSVHTIADLTERDRIALPSVKLSNAALVLEMAAARLWGPDQYARLDPLTVSLGHPDAAAQLTGTGEINAHFASPPFEHFERRFAQVHTILSSIDVMGDTTLTDVWTTTKFAREHPLIVQAMFESMTEVIDTINRDKDAAADLYLRLSHDRISKADLMEVLADPHIIFSTTPKGTMAFAEFMHRTGSLKALPGDWKDMFLPVAYGLAGN